MNDKETAENILGGLIGRFVWRSRWSVKPPRTTLQRLNSQDLRLKDKLITTLN
jgi:hypothetical protein